MKIHNHDTLEAPASFLRVHPTEGSSSTTGMPIVTPAVTAASSYCRPNCSRICHRQHFVDLQSARSPRHPRPQMAEKSWMSTLRRCATSERACPRRQRCSGRDGHMLVSTLLLGESVPCADPDKSSTSQLPRDALHRVDRAELDEPSCASPSGLSNCNVKAGITSPDKSHYVIPQYCHLHSERAARSQHDRSGGIT